MQTLLATYFRYYASFCVESDGVAMRTLLK